MIKLHSIVKQLVVWSLALTCFVACEDVFDIESNTYVKTDDYFKSIHDLDNAARGMYDGLQDCVEKMLIWGEIRGDLVTETENTPWDIKEFNDLSVSSVNQYTDWSEFYAVINSANLIIENAHKVVEHDYNFDEKQAIQFVAEAVNVRSLCYFWLVRTFGDVPFVLNSFSNNINDTKIDTVWHNNGDYSLEEVPVFIVDPTDADIILDSLEVQLARYAGIERIYSQEITDGGGRDPLIYSSRFKAVTNLALRADILLWRMGPDDRETARKVIELTDSIFSFRPEQYSLGNYETSPVCYNNKGNPVQRWIEIFTGEGSLMPESIFEIRFQKRTKPDFNVLQQYTSRYASEGGRYIIKPTRKAIDYWQNDEFWGKIYIDTCDIMRGYNASFTGNYNEEEDIWEDAEVFKFLVASEGGLRRTAKESDSNWTIYRMADILAMQCEALNRTRESLAAIRKLQGSDYWNLNWSFDPSREGPMGLRKRACVVEYVTSNDAPPELEEAEEIILEERAKELAFEGRRWFDLIRIAKRGQLQFFLDEMEFAAEDHRKANIRQQASNPENWFLPYHEDAKKYFVNPNYRNKAIDKALDNL